MTDIFQQCVSSLAIVMSQRAQLPLYLSSPLPPPNPPTNIFPLSVCFLLLLPRRPLPPPPAPPLAPHPLWHLPSLCGPDGHTAPLRRPANPSLYLRCLSGLFREISLADFYARQPRELDPWTKFIKGKAL